MSLFALICDAHLNMWVIINTNPIPTKNIQFTKHVFIKKLDRILKLIIFLF